jgi:hypothetical protein
MQELFFFRTTPLDLLDASIEPFVPSCLALLGGLSIQQGGNPSPLLFAVFITAALRISSSEFFSKRHP